MKSAVVISFAARLPEGQSLPALSKTRARVAVRDLLPGLCEGVQLLKVGGKALLYLPPSLSFPENMASATGPCNTDSQNATRRDSSGSFFRAVVR